MTDIAKAACLFVVGLAFLMTLGDAFLKGSRQPTASLTVSRPKPQDPHKEETPAERPETPAPSSDYARACAAYDPVAHPEQVIDILEYASDVSGTPVDILYAVWRKETGHFDGAGLASGGCNMKQELALRDSAAGTRHWDSMLRMGKAFGWDKLYGSGLERMTCSCPGHDSNGDRRGYGGCCGPFQFSGEEVADTYALPNRLDPMTFCGGALVAGWELKAYHDSAFTPHKNRWGQVVPGRGTAVMAQFGYTDRDLAAWHAAMSRYYGGDEGGVYGSTAVDKWRQFHAWHLIDLEHPGYLVKQILDMQDTKYGLLYLRKFRAATDSAAFE